MIERMMDRAIALLLWLSVIYFGVHVIVYFVR